MSKAAYYYDLCCKHKGKMVRLYDLSGREYVGRIAHVDRTYVWLEPSSSHGLGFGYGYYGGYYRRGSWIPIALAGLGGFALAAAFFW